MVCKYFNLEIKFKKVQLYEITYLVGQQRNIWWCIMKKAINIERSVSKKMIEAENYVDKYIKKYGKPPTYRNVALALNLNSPRK